jgi:hypothetical protein
MVGASGAGPTVTRSGPLPARATFTGMRHRRIIIPSVIALVVALAVTGAVVLNGRRSEFARVAAARIPAFPGVTDCSPYDGAGEVRLDQVFITVLAMLRLKFDTDPARSWFGKVPVSTREDEIKDHYASAMPSVLRPDNDFPDLGIDHRLWVWSYDGWSGSRAVAVAFIEYPYSGAAMRGRPPVADFKWLMVIDTMPSDKLDAEPDPPCVR